MSQRAPEKIIPFAPSPRDQRPADGDPIDRSGLAIVSMLQEAVDVAKQNCERAMDIAHKLSLQLRTAEDRIAQLEGDIRHYQERAARAEKWMHRIHSEIEDRFFKDPTIAANNQQPQQRR
jgi:predicted  nucleic acid-binding Zn-ribbon protein